MLRTTLKVIFFLLVFSLNVYSQTTTESINLKWEEQPRQYKLSEDHTLHYFHFHDASYDDSKPQLPIFSKQIRLSTYGDITARLVNEQYTPITNKADIDLSEIGAIDIKTAVSFSRKTPIGVVYFVPIRKNSATGEYEKLVSADLQVSLRAKPSPYSSSSSSSRSNVTSSKLSNGQLYKISIANTGIYKIDYNFLKDIGVDVDNIDPRKIQILGNGGEALAESMAIPKIEDVLENAIYVSGEGDGSFDAGDYILFYGTGTNTWSFNNQNSCGKFKHKRNPYTDESHYFIKIASTNGKRVGTQASIPNTSYTTSSYDALKHHETDETNLMEEEFALPPSGREWYGESFRITRTRDFNFPFSNRIENEPVIIQSDLAVRVFETGIATLNMNGSLVGVPLATPLTTIYVYTDYAMRLAFPCASKVVAGQGVTAQISLNHTSSSAEMWLNYLSVQARCQLTFNGGQLSFRDSRTLGQTDATYQLANANNVTIWDVTDPSNVMVQSTTGTGSVSFGVDASILHEFIAFDGNQFNTPTSKGAISQQNLHAVGSGLNGAPSVPEAIFIYHSSLKSEVERLAAHRRTFNNMTVDIVDVADIYNEFSSGNEDVTAIRDYCRMLYERGTVATPFTHLLLFGLGTFDYKSLGDSRTSANNPNLIPVYETAESMHPINTYTSDDYFALLDTLESMPNFGLLDIAVGRLPAANLSEATVYVNKIIGYETDHDFMLDWKNRLCFVADDGDNNLHLYDAEGVANSIAQQDSVYNLEKIYIDAFTQVSTSGGERYPDAKASFLDILFQGSFVVNYLGHGGEDGWTQERIFTSTDINALSNTKKLPLFITATCSFGPHDDATKVSAGELLMLNPNGGAISILTTVRVVIASHNERLVRNTFNVIFDRNPDGSRPTTGEVMQSAKNNAAISPPTNSRKYALLGDPTMRLAYPIHNIITTAFDGQPVSGSDTIKALQRVTISGEVVDLNNTLLTNFNGTVYPTVFDKEDKIYTLGNDAGSFADDFYLRKKIIFKGQARVVDGKFSFTFVVPKDINYSLGYGKISYYAENGSDIDAAGYYNGLIVGGSYPSAVADNEGPIVDVYMNNEQFASGGITDNNPKLLVKLYDENGINTVGNGIGHDLTGDLTKPNLSDERYILNSFYESTKDSFTHGTVIYPLKDLEPGLHTIKVKAWDTYNNPGEGSTEFVVAESADMALDHVLNYPNPFTTNTKFFFEHNFPYQALEVQVQIYTVSGKLIKTINHDISAEANTGYRIEGIDWDGLDDYGDRIGKGVYVYKIFVQAENTTDKTKQSSKFQKLVVLK